MTNKKFKLAAMSVALTACVAAQPIAAHATTADEVEDPSTDAKQGENAETDQNTAEGTEQGKNQQDEEKSTPVIGDAEVKYDKENPTENPDGSTTEKGDIIKKDDSEEKGEESGSEEETEEKGEESGSEGETEEKGEESGSEGETEEKGEESGSEGETEEKGEESGSEGETEEKGEESGSEGETEEKGEESGSEEEKKEETDKIGEAEKTEKDNESTSEVTPNPGADPIPDTSGDRETVTTPNEDGSTTITQPTVTPGTETTTTTGSGSAKADLDATTETKKDNINLKDELGDVLPDWKTDTGNKFGDYEVTGNTTSEDGNSKLLTLRKETTDTKEMTAEDIAKLVEADKPTVNEDGSYTLTRTEKYTDENGVEQTRTTYITVTGSTVTIKTTTELSVKVEKGTTEFDKDITEDSYTYPPTTTIEDNKGNKYEINLSDLLKDTNVEQGGSYTIEKDGLVYEITFGQEDEGTQINYSLNDLAAMMGGTKYELIDGVLYYIADGEKAPLTVDQVNALRKSLSVSVKVTNAKGSSTSGTEITGDKEEAAAAAKEDAIKNALIKAAEKEGLTITADQITLDGTGAWTYSKDGKTYTFNYTVKDTVTDGGKVSVDASTVTDTTHDQVDAAWSNKVTGTAYVSGSTITEAGKDTAYDTGAGALGLGSDFKTAPAGAKEGSVKYDGSGRISEYTDADGKIHKFTYNTVSLGDLSAEEFAKLEETAKREGWTTEQLTASLTRVDWEIWTPEKTETTTTTIQNPETITVKSDSEWNLSGSDKFTLTYKNGDKIEGLESKGNGVFSKKDSKGVETIVTVTTSTLDEPALRKSFDEKFGAGNYELDLDNNKITYKQDGKTYVASYSNTVETVNVEVRTPHEVTGTGSSEEEAKNDFLEKLKKARAEAAAEGCNLIVDLPDGTKLTITESTDWEEIEEVIKSVVNFTAMDDADLIQYLEKQKADAAGKDYTGEKGGTYYKKADGSLIAEKDCDWDWNGYFYWEKSGNHYKKVYVTEKVTVDPDHIGHLDLATDSKLNLAEKDANGNLTDDCVLVEKKLEWNASAADLVNQKNNQTANLLDRITYDDENDNDPSTGHYEFPRASWDGGSDSMNNAPTQSVFYKVTGKVAYGKLGDAYEATATGWDRWNGTYFKDSDYAAAKAKAEADLAKYKAEHPELDLSGARVVEVYKDQDKNGERYYQIYLYESNLTAYGYLSDASNTCGNAHYDKQNSRNYVGGYDLTLGDLTQVSEKEIVAIGKNTYNCSATFTRVKKTQDLFNTSLTYTNQTVTETTTTKSELEKKDTALSGIYNASYKKENNYTKGTAPNGIEATGEGSYSSYDYTDFEETTAESDLTATRKDGFLHVLFRTVNDAVASAESKTTTTKKDASVDYTYTTVETKDVLIPGYTEVIVPPTTPETPDTPDTPETPETPETPDIPDEEDDVIIPVAPVLPPVQDATPDAVVTPEAPVLPPVQDAVPDTVVTPEAPVLPPVQDATVSALPKTGVNWAGAFSMALSGMLMMVLGAFTSLKYKEKH